MHDTQSNRTPSWRLCDLAELTAKVLVLDSMRLRVVTNEVEPSRDGRSVYFTSSQGDDNARESRTAAAGGKAA